MSNRRSHLILVGLILLALAGVAALAVPGSPVHKKLTLGLDLQGGLEVVLKAVPPQNHQLTSDDMDRSVSIMRSRIDKLGVAEPEIRKQGKDQIVIQLAGVHDPAKAAAIIGKTAELQFYDLETSVTGPSTDGNGGVIANPSLYNLLSQVQDDAKVGTPSAYYLFNAKKQVKAGPEDTREKLLDTPRLQGEVPKGWTVLAVPEHMTVISCETADGCPGVPQAAAGKATVYYLFKYYPDRPINPIPAATGRDLKLSAIRADISSQGQGNVVQLGFNSAGNKAFKEITGAEAVRGQAAADSAGQGGSSDLNTVTQFAQHFAIVLDGELKSTPYIDYKQNPNGIDPSTGGAEISNIASFGEAKDLALVLQTGALPVKFEQIERTDVSATLGKDSLKEAKTAALIGLLLVAVFLLVLYRFLGVVAVIGLGIYAALLYAAILILNVTLTLPGFAGLILTIGVAADANVVIFERIKEEVRTGKSMRAAISSGYEKGFHTIIDANVVTCITALVLFAVATAGVKGFALMLLIGTVISLVTAVAATRAMLGLLAGFRWFEDPRFMGATASEIPNWQRIDVVGRRRLWLTLSLVAVVLSIIAIAVQGLNLGIDFKGGVQVTFTTPGPTPISTVRSQIAEKGAVVQGRGATIGSDSYRSFQIRLKKLSAAKQDALTNSLQQHVDAQKLGIKNVSASFSRQILRGAIVAVIVSFALIAFYVTLRYRWRFAVPILRTLLNDIPIVLGVYAISGREVTVATVAAVLTILGYSVYDTIIVFDRVRENMKLMPRASIATIANLSVSEVLRRSIVTSVITLLPIVALFIFGGATLKDFAFAIIVGISVGAVSTIFIATPLLTQFMERDPEYARRKGQEPEEGLQPPEDGKAVRPPRPLVPGSGSATVDGGMVALEDATSAAGSDPAPSPGEAVPQPAGSAQAKRERRRQRRRSRPHGRAR
jgi:SecD/SecF fusion protein